MAQTKSATYWSQRKAKSSGKLVRWERLLTVLGNGGVVTLKEIKDTMDYSNMYRIGAEILTLKYNGGVVRANKNGRNVVGYELMNASEMVAKFLTPRGFTVANIVGRDAINSLSDLNAEVDNAPSKLAQAHAAVAVKSAAKKKVKAPVIEDEVTEITE
jgi:hypothetical protein